MKKQGLVLILLLFFSLNCQASLPKQSGDLQSYLESLTFGSENDGVFKIPSAQQLSDFENVVRLILQAKYDQAESLAQTLDYQLLEYTDTVSAKTFYLLREINPHPSVLANGGGFYIFRPAATRNVAIRAPHPRFDSNSNLSAIAAFLAGDYRYFMMAGSHRRSHPEPSSCQDFSDYRPSDAVHNTAHYFYAAHMKLEDFDSSIHYIELHGFGSESLERIASQCNTGGNSLVVNMSETISDDDAGEFTLMHMLESVILEDDAINACVYSTILDTGDADKYSRDLGGSTNTNARYTNRSTSVCDQAAQHEDNSHRFLHLEQSFGIRQSNVNRQLMAGYVNEAVQRYFDAINGKPFQINSGLNDAWFNPLTDGQGFFINVFPALDVVVLSWFTYDTQLPPADAVSHLGNAGHRWLNAAGPIDGNRATLEISMSSGGIFDTASEVTKVSGGSIILTFENCNAATVVYDIPSAGLQGTIPIRRVANDNISLCEALGAE